MQSTEELITRKIKELEAQLERKVAVLLDAAHEKDWHGVSDYANDLREIERSITANKEIIDLLTQT